MMIHIKISREPRCVQKLMSRDSGKFVSLENTVGLVPMLKSLAIGR